MIVDHIANLGRDEVEVSEYKKKEVDGVARPESLLEISVDRNRRTVGPSARREEASIRSLR